MEEWEDGKGNKIKIKDMPTKYIANVINYLYRHKLTKKNVKKIESLSKELIDRGCDLNEYINEVVDVLEGMNEYEMVEYIDKMYGITLYTEDDVRKCMNYACEEGQRGYDIGDLPIPSISYLRY